MKKFLSWMLVFVLAVSCLTSCGGDDKGKAPNDDKGGNVESDKHEQNNEEVGDGGLSIGEPDEGLDEGFLIDGEEDELSGMSFETMMNGLEFPDEGESYIVIDLSYTYQDMINEAGAGEDGLDEDTFGEGMDLSQVAMAVKATLTTTFNSEMAHSSGVMTMEIPFLLAMFGMSMEDLSEAGITSEDMATVMPLESWYRKLDDNTWGSWVLQSDDEDADEATWEYSEVSGGLVFGVNDYSVFTDMEELSPGSWAGYMNAEDVNSLMSAMEASEDDLTVTEGYERLPVRLTVYDNRITDFVIEFGTLGTISVFYDYDLDVSLEFPTELITR